MKYNITILPQNINIEVEEGTTLLDVQIMAGIKPDAPCGGKGSCGKCLVKLIGDNGEHTVVKSCQTKVNCSMTIEVIEQKEINILEKGIKRYFKINPYLEFDNSDNKNKYGVAFDIGTTTVVCYLLDLSTGRELAHSSTLNPQSQYGADVISRIEYSLENGVEILTSTIRTSLNQLVEEVCVKASIKCEDIYIATIAGNTCMHHLYMGINPKSLTVVPYDATVKDEMVISSKESGLNINPDGKVLVLPNIAGFVGADTVACLLATDFYDLDELTLMIDIGTNGEMVMGNKDRMIACSTAAGPAFEGAKIECGMRGRSGAIDHVKIDGEKLVCHVIDDAKPEGICGSGLMDAIACCIELGIISESGKIDDSHFLVRQNPKNGMNVISLEGDVYLSQKDIREVQLAKGAIASGITLLAKTLGIKLLDVKKVMIAGAFGNYMNPHSACVIGMIPLELENKIEMIGNAAGEGSKIATLSKAEFLRAQEIRNKVEFLELASDPEFQDIFVDNLLFGEE